MSLFGKRTRDYTRTNQPFELRHPGHPLGSDYLIQMETGCWIWKWSVNRDNYAYVWSAGRNRRVNRILMCAEAGQDVRHSQYCSSRRCINPQHLRIGSKSDNHRDKVFDGNLTHPRKLTDAQAEEIRKSYADGSVSQQQLAREYGVARGSICQILRRKTYDYNLAEYARH